jgi:fumarate hydratase subunit alpha/L(+)-tartrate dehydratase alpha subunit
VCSPDGLNLGQRHVTISTVGLPARIRQLADAGKGYHLAVSLHAPTDELRNQLVPPNAKVGIDAVLEAGGKACPPCVVGVGLGGSADLAMRLAKEAIFRPIGTPNPDPQIADLEAELLAAINKTGIGPMGLGGDTTAFAVHIEEAHTHITMNPVGINFQCWRGERASATVHPDGRVEYGY